MKNIKFHILNVDICDSRLDYKRHQTESCSGMFLGSETGIRRLDKYGSVVLFSVCTARSERSALRPDRFTAIE